MDEPQSPPFNHQKAKAGSQTVVLVRFLNDYAETLENALKRRRARHAEDRELQSWMRSPAAMKCGRPGYHRGPPGHGKTELSLKIAVKASQVDLPRSIPPARRDFQKYGR